MAGATAEEQEKEQSQPNDEEVGGSCHGQSDEGQRRGTGTRDETQVEDYQLGVDY